jgi:hypothetical protein
MGRALNRTLRAVLALFTGYTLRKGPAHTPPSGLIRDPGIFKHTDGFSRSTAPVNWTFLYNFRADSSFTVVSPWT